jgi:hypothetical protein
MTSGSLVRLPIFVGNLYRWTSTEAMKVRGAPKSMPFIYILFFNLTYADWSWVFREELT